MSKPFDPAHPSHADRDLAAGFGPDFDDEVDRQMHAWKMGDGYARRAAERAQQLEHRRQDVDRVIGGNGTFNAGGGW